MLKLSLFCTNIAQACRQPEAIAPKRISCSFLKHTVGDLLVRGRPLGREGTWTSSSSEHRRAQGNPFCQHHIPESLPLQQRTSRTSYTQTSRKTLKCFLCWLSGICSWDQCLTTSTAVVLSPEQHQLKSIPRSLGTFIPESQNSSAHPRARIQIKTITLPKWSRYTSAPAGRNIYFYTTRSHDNHIFI